MSIETLFRICNTGITPFWLLLAVAPRAKITTMLVHRPVVPVLLGLVYGVLLIMASDTPPEANMMSLGGVQALFTSKFVTTAGWIHYLVFDLFVGAWEARDAARRGIPHWMVVPCLFFTLMFGPLGLLAYLILRWIKTRAVTLEES